MKKFALISFVVIGCGIFISSFISSDKLQPVVMASPTSVSSVTGKWKLDKGHSSVRFNVTHMVVSETEGTFKSFDGTMEHTKPDYSDAKIAFTIDVNSVSTDNERRDNHLKSDDFFNAEKYPQMKFESTSFQPLGNNKFKLAGNLTIRDVTKPVVFDVTYGGTIKAGKGEKSGFKATTTINRFDYNLKWDRATEAGSLVVSKEVEITVKAEFDSVQ